MLPKCQQSPTPTMPAKCSCSTRSTASDNTQAQATLHNVNNIQEFTLSNLALLPVKMLRSQLKRYKLSPVGNITTIANRLYQFLHSAVLSNITPTDVEPPPTAAETSHTTPLTINMPWQIMEQLSSFFQQFNNVIHIVSTDTAGNNPPSDGDTICDIDDLLSVASNQPVAPTSQCFSIAYTTSNPAVTATVPTFSQATTTPSFTSTSVPVPAQPTASANQLLMSTSVPLFVQHIANQTLSPPVPPRIQDCIVQGEFVDFASLLSKAMFSGALKPETHSTLTVQLASSGDDISIQLASNLRKITSFSSWRRGTYIFQLSLTTHLLKLLNFCVPMHHYFSQHPISHSSLAKLRYPIPHACILRLQFVLGCKFMTAAKPPQSAQRPCKHCGATNHYLINCPFHPNHLLTIPGGQRAITRGQPN